MPFMYVAIATCLRPTILPNDAKVLDHVRLIGATQIWWFLSPDRRLQWVMTPPEKKTHNACLLFFIVICPNLDGCGPSKRLKFVTVAMLIRPGTLGATTKRSRWLADLKQRHHYLGKCQT